MSGLLYTYLVGCRPVSDLCGNGELTLGEAFKASVERKTKTEESTVDSQIVI